MRKTLIILGILLSVPAFAMCPIDDNEAVCSSSVPGMRAQFTPTYNPQSAISEFSDTPEARLNPIKRDNIEYQMRQFAPTENNFNYNSSCQFGVCLENRNSPLFQQSR